METTKLTLSIPKRVLLEAKTYSQKTGQPLSRLVGRYFSLLASNLKKKGATDDEVTPKVRRVTGIARSRHDEKELLSGALLQKYRR